MVRVTRLALATLVSLAACSDPAPKVALDADSLEFGTVVLGTPTQRTLTLTNSGDAAAALRELRIVGGDSQFTVESSFSAIELPTSESVSFVVTFRPAALGAQTAELTLSVANERKSLALHGEGVPRSASGPRLAIASRTLDFGDAAPGIERQFVVSNVGDAPLRFGTWSGQDWAPAAPALAGPDASAFELRASWPHQATELAPGEAAELGVRIVAPTLGDKHATLNVRTDDPAEPAVEIVVRANVVASPPCTWEVESATLRLMSESASPVVRSFAIRALATSPSEWCVVRDLAVAQGSSPAFSLPDGPIAWAAIRRGEQLDVQVQFAPGERPVEAGEIRFNVDASARSSATVTLFGQRNPEPCLMVAPGELDFGEMQATCRTEPRRVEVWNTCEHPVTAEAISLPLGGPEFRLALAPGLPWTIPPDDGVMFDVTYEPFDAGPDTGAVVLTLQGGTTAAVLLQGRGTPVRVQTDVFEIAPLPKVDLLLVIDDSPSMADKQLSIAANLSAFFQFVDSTVPGRQVDYRIAVTTTAVDAAHGGTGTGADFANGRFVPLTGSGPRVITPTTPDRATAFAQNTAVGATTPCDGFLLQPMRLALSEPLLSTHNAGFLRPGAFLAIVLVTDGADHDSEPLAAFQAFLLGLKPWPNEVSFNAILPTLPAAPNGCTYGEADAGVSTRIKDLVTRTGGVYDDICTPDWYRSLTKTGGIPSDHSHYFLSNYPGLSGPDSIVIEIDGERVPAADASGKVLWRYSSGVNAIVFEPDSLPPPGSTMTVRYRVACESPI